jgi:hypothetical protein
MRNNVVAVAIPARFQIGFPLSANKRSAEIPGYHCWAEFYLDSVGRCEIYRITSATESPGICHPTSNGGRIETGLIARLLARFLIRNSLARLVADKFRGFAQKNARNGRFRRRFEKEASDGRASWTQTRRVLSP